MHLSEELAMLTEMQTDPALSPDTRKLIAARLRSVQALHARRDNRPLPNPAQQLAELSQQLSDTRALMDEEQIHRQEELRWQGAAYAARMAGRPEPARPQLQLSAAAQRAAKRRFGPSLDDQLAPPPVPAERCVPNTEGAMRAAGRDFARRLAEELRSEQRGNLAPMVDR